MLLENILVKFEEFNEKGDILATPENKNIFNTLINYQADMVPIKGKRIKLRHTKYTKDLDPNTYMGKYGRCILEVRSFNMPSKDTGDKIKILIIYLKHIDIV